MTLQEAKSIARQAIECLASERMDNLLDDGRDDRNAPQNRRYCSAVTELSDWRHRLALIDIDGIDDEVLDAAWRETSGDTFNWDIGMYNHVIRYANYILTL